MILQTTFFTCLRQLVIKPVEKNIQLLHLSKGLKNCIPEVRNNIVQLSKSSRIPLFTNINPFKSSTGIVKNGLIIKYQTRIACTFLERQLCLYSLTDEEGKLYQQLLAPRTFCRLMCIL